MLRKECVGLQSNSDYNLKRKLVICRRKNGKINKSSKTTRKLQKSI